jgi:hypothetical protein
MKLKITSYNQTWASGGETAGFGKKGVHGGMDSQPHVTEIAQHTAHVRIIE